MKVRVTLEQKEIEEAIKDYVDGKMGGRAQELTLFVRSKENYRGRSSWESAAVVMMNDQAQSEEIAAQRFLDKSDPKQKPELKAEVTIDE